MTSKEIKNALVTFSSENFQKQNGMNSALLIFVPVHLAYPALNILYFKMVKTIFFLIKSQYKHTPKNYQNPWAIHYTKLYGSLLWEKTGKPVRFDY